MDGIRKSPIAAGVAATALFFYGLITLNALIFPSVADQLLATFFQLSPTVHAEGVFEPHLDTFVSGAALLTGGSYVFTLISLTLAQALSHLGQRRVIHIVPQH